MQLARHRQRPHRSARRCGRLPLRRPRRRRDRRRSHRPPPRFAARFPPPAHRRRGQANSPSTTISRTRARRSSPIRPIRASASNCPPTAPTTCYLGDTQGKGGPDYAYRLRISHPQPDFELRVTPSSINARAGATVPVTVYALRRDGFSGEIALKLKDAPAGFIAERRRHPGQRGPGAPHPDRALAPRSRRTLSRSKAAPPSPATKCAAPASPPKT